VHPNATPTAQPPAPVTGIDYLALVRDRHTQVLAERVNYAALTEPATTSTTTAITSAITSAAITADSVHVLPGQTDLLELLDPTTPTDDDHRQELS
jgi:hypothetical protein